MTDSSQITITRASRGRDRRADYLVDIDGRERGKLGRGKTLSVEVAPGRHHVRMRFASSGSRTVEVDVSDGGNVRLRAKPTTAWKAGPRILNWLLSGKASLRREEFFGPNSWLGADGYIDLDIVSSPHS